MYQLPFLLIIFCSLSLSCVPRNPTIGTPPTIGNQIQPTVIYVIDRLQAKGKKRVAVALFRNQDNKGTLFSGFMAEKFHLALTTEGENVQLEIINRDRLCDLINDNKLGVEGLLDPKTIPKLGEMAGAEVVIAGKYTEQDQYIDFTLELIDLERGINLAAKEFKIRRSVDVNSLLYTEISKKDICKQPWQKL